MLRVLFVEDSAADAELTARELQRAGFEVHHERVDDAASMAAALQRGQWDIIISDESMPGFDALQALDVLHASGRDIPVIVVTGTSGEKAAARLMRAGAQDFILKDQLARLGPAVRRELRESQRRRQQRDDARARVEPQLRLEQAHRRLSLLSLRLLEAQESERARLARGLHDGVGQQLTALQLQLEALRRRAATHGDQAQLDDCLGLVRQVLGEVRSLSLDLRPPQLDTLGLAAALRWYAERKLGTLPGTVLHFDAEGVPAMPVTLETACFRIAQEALTNVVRHARPSRVDISLSVVSGHLRMLIRDNGPGFDVGEQYESSIRGESSGLLNMQERASLVGGRLELRSGDDGTRVLLEVPVEESLDGPAAGGRA